MNNYIRNHEQYFDPTAGEALRNIERGERMDIKTGDLLRFTRPGGSVRHYAVIAMNGQIASMVLMVDTPFSWNVPIMCGREMYAMPEKTEWTNVLKSDPEKIRTMTPEELQTLREGVRTALGFEGVQYVVPDEYATMVEDQARDLIRATAQAEVYKGLYEDLLRKTLGELE